MLTLQRDEQKIIDTLNICEKWNDKAFQIKDEINGNTVLHSAIAHHRNRVVDFLAERIKDLDVPNKFSKTPVDLCVVHNNQPALAKLLEKGANPNGSKSAFTPLFSSILDNKIELARTLLNDPRTDSTGRFRYPMGDGSQPTPLEFARKEGHKEIVKLLLARSRGRLSFQ